MDISQAEPSNSIHESQHTDDINYEAKYRALVQKYNRLVQRYNQLKLEQSLRTNCEQQTMQTPAQSFHTVEDMIDTASIINMDVLGY